MAYDQDYYHKFDSMIPEVEARGHTIVKAKFNECDKVDTDFLAFDSMYYDGVYKCIKTNILRTGKTAHVVMIIYPKEEGKHEYKHRQGHFIISQKDGQYWVDVNATGNPMTYSHPVFNVWEGPVQSGVWDGLSWSIRTAHDIGGGARMIQAVVFKPKGFT
jgi:hypothetical protein